MRMKGEKIKLTTLKARNTDDRLLLCDTKEEILAFIEDIDKENRLLRQLIAKHSKENEYDVNRESTKIKKARLRLTKLKRKGVEARNKLSGLKKTSASLGRFLKAAEGEFDEDVYKRILNIASKL